MPPTWIPEPKPDRTPIEEMNKKFSEGSVGLGVAARAIGVQDHQRMLAMHAQRLCEDHRIQQMAAGYRDKEDGIECPKEENEMGDISVSGDSYHYQVPTTTIHKANVWEKAIPFIAVGSVLSVLFLAYLLSQEPEVNPLPVNPNTDTVIAVSVE